MSSKESQKKLIRFLLESKSVQVNTQDPFTYPSGLRSPIFCDYRMLLGDVDAREEITKEFIKIINPSTVDIIAGTATAAIGWAAFVAKDLRKPMSYVRVIKKDHGAKKLIEGASIKDKNIILFEDIIATGYSVLWASDILKEEGAKNIKVLSIYNYEFAETPQKFAEKGVGYESLTNFTTLMEVGKELNYFTQNQIEMTREWIKDPESWYGKYF